MKQNKHIEIYEFTHKDINVMVKIDYIRNEISLVDQCGYGKKKYVFADRGVEFMNGWLNVLEALTEAVKDAKTKFEKNLAEVSAFNADKIEKLLEKELAK